MRILEHYPSNVRIRIRSKKVHGGFKQLSVDITSRSEDSNSNFLIIIDN